MSSSPPLFPPLSPTFPSFPAINSQFTVSADGVGMFNVSSLLVFSVLNIPSSLRPCLSLNILHRNSPSIRRPPPRCTSLSFVFLFFFFFWCRSHSVLNCWAAGMRPFHFLSHRPAFLTLISSFIAPRSINFHRTDAHGLRTDTQYN